MAQDLFSVSIVSLPLNFTVLLHPESIKSLGIEENGFALIKGINGQITVVKVIKDPDCPITTTRITHSVQLTLAASNGDSVPILPFSGKDRCEAIQIAPLFEKTEEDFTQAVKHYFSLDSRPISADSIFTIRVGHQERAFKILSCLPVDRSFSNKSTKIYFTNEPGPLLPKPPLPKHLSSLVLDQQIVDFVKNNIYFPANRQKLLKSLNLPGSSGIIIDGPSGSGRTSLLSAISNTINIPSIYCASKRLKKLSVNDYVDKLNQIFGFTAEKAQCLIMFDDLDSIISTFRETKTTSERCKLATFFNLLDVVMQRSGIIVVATVTNIESIEPALIRDGRFGHQISLHNPSFEQRKELIKMYTAGMRVDRDDLDEIAKRIDDSVCAKEIERISRFAVASLIEEVTGTTGSDVSDALTVYALNTKMKAMHFGGRSGGDRSRRRRHNDGTASKNRRRHRRRHDDSDSDDDDDDDDNDSDDDDDNNGDRRRSSQRRRRRTRRRHDDDSDDDDDDDDNDNFRQRRKNQRRKKNNDDEDEDDENDDDDLFSKKKRSSQKRRRNEDDDEDERPSNRRRRTARKRSDESDDDDEVDNRRRRKRKQIDDDEDDEENSSKRRRKRKNDDSDDDEERRPRRRRHNNEDDDDDDVERPRQRRRG